MAAGRFVWLKSIFLVHKGTKMLALLLGTLTWFAIQSVIGVTQVLSDVPIEVRALEPGVAVLSQSQSTAKVMFKGSRSDVAELVNSKDRGNVRIVVYVKSKEPVGHIRIPLRPGDVEGSRGVRVVRVNWPGEIDVELDREAERQFVVSVPRKGKLAIGQVASVDVDPKTVKVIGPKQKLDKLQADHLLNVYTETIDLAGVSESFTKSVRILSPSDRWASKLDPSEAVVTVTIERKQSRREWKDVPVMALIPPGRSVKISLRPTAVKVSATGRSEVLDELSTEDFQVMVDCRGLDMSTTYDLPVTCTMLKGGEVSAEVEPAFVKVVLTDEPIRTP